MGTPQTRTRKRATDEQHALGGQRGELHRHHDRGGDHLHRRRHHCDRRGLLLPAPAAPGRRGGHGVVPQAGRGRGGQPAGAALPAGEADRERARGREADAGRGMSSHDPGPAITLPARGNPVRLLLSAAPWKAAAFLGSYVLVSGVLAAIALAAAGTGALLAITLAGIPVMVVASGAIRFAADAERARLRTVLAAPLHGRYRQPARAGVF